MKVDQRNERDVEKLRIVPRVFGHFHRNMGKPTRLKGCNTIPRIPQCFRADGIPAALSISQGLIG